MQQKHLGFIASRYCEGSGHGKWQKEDMEGERFFLI
jgi:hypothetical protein